MSRKHKRLALYTSPLALVAALMLIAKIQVDRVRNDAERLAEVGTSILRTFQELGEGIAAGDLARVTAVYADGYHHPAQGDWTLEPRSERDGVAVADWRSGPPRPFTKADVMVQMRHFLAGLGEVAHAKVKLDALEGTSSGDRRAVARTVLWLRGVDDAGKAYETQATFRLWLERDRAGASGWRIARQELLYGETVTGERRGFADVAAEAGIDFVARHNPAFDTDEWRPERFGIIRYGTAGVSAGDFDGDGFDDLFFGDGASPRLYRNRGDGTFADVTLDAGLPAELDSANVGLFADYDNDGDQDLFIGRFTGENRLYRNDGPGARPRFVDVTAGAGLGGEMVTVASAADYDRDGDLDLYLGRYLDPRTELPTTLFYTRNGAGNTLLRNDGDLTFTDVTAEAGVRDGGLTLGVVWGDVDRDGDPDLYVANDFGRNALLRNDGAGPDGVVTFTDVSAEQGALDFGYGMSAEMGDVDNDGDLDLYVSNVRSSQRWFGQATTLYQYLVTSLRQGTIFEDYPLYEEIFGYAGDRWRDYGDKMIRGNTLLLNDGAGNFVDVAETARANPFGWYWGSTVLDYDNDGRLDLYAANGWISGKTWDDL